MNLNVSPSKQQADTISVFLSVDGQKKTLLFSAAQARRKAQALDIANNTIDFAFADLVSGYLVEKGNHTTFDQKQNNFSVTLLDAKSLDISIAAEIYDLRQASAWLFCFFCNQAGEVILKQRIEFDSGSAKETLTVPPSAKKMCFAVRLDGAGTIGNLRLDLTIMQPQAKLKKTNPIADEVTALIHKRDYNSGIEIMRALTNPEHKDRKLLLRCHAGQHEFSDVVREFEAMSSKRQIEFPSRILYLTALANLGEKEKAKNLILDHCLHIKLDQRTVEFMATVYPFAASLCDDLGNRILSRIITADIAWSKKSLNSLIRCAHDLIERHRYKDFYTLTDRLYRLDLNTEDQAKLNILSAHTSFLAKRYDLQLNYLNKAIAAYGSEPLFTYDHKTPVSFDCLSCLNANPKSVYGPKVSILMTCFNSAETIEYALRSLIAQTYADIEIIVIDDGSHDNSCEIVQKIMQEDPRVILIKQTMNGGTYLAKNHGLQRASGTFVTCQDSDDWAHPQKIERLASALQANVSIIAATVQHLRYDPVRGFRSHGGYIRMDASSMMYRREIVLEKVGYYDSVRAGADSEFQFRIERLFGKDTILKLPDFLSLVLWSEKSLSGGGKFAIDDDAGVFSPTRNAYRHAFCSWHQTAVDLYMPFPQLTRRFLAPEEILP